MAKQAQTQSRLTKPGTRTPAASTDSTFPPASSRPGSQSMILDLSLLEVVTVASWTPTWIQSWQSPRMGQVERGGPGDSQLSSHFRCLGFRLAQGLLRRTTAILRDPALLCAVPSSLSGSVVLKADCLRDVAGDPSVPSAAGTETVACHQPTGQGHWGSHFGCVLARAHATAQPAVACEMESSRPVSSFRIDASPFSIHGPLKQRSAMPFSLSRGPTCTTRVHE